MKLAAAVLGAALMIGLGVAAAAAPPNAAALVKHRQAVMKRHAADLKAIKAYLEGKASAATALAKARDLAASIKRLPSLFPAGTSSADVAKSGAKPTIWSEPKRFRAAEKNAAGLADVLLAAVESGDKQKIATAFGELGKNGCGSCHRSFAIRTTH